MNDVSIYIVKIKNKRIIFLKKYGDFIDEGEAIKHIEYYGIENAFIVDKNGDIISY